MNTLGSSLIIIFIIIIIIIIIYLVDENHIITNAKNLNQTICLLLVCVQHLGKN